jgi:glc operon protein GlcG
MYSRRLLQNKSLHFLATKRAQNIAPFIFYKRQNMLTKPILTLEDAKRIAAAAEIEARANDWAVTIAVVDDGGHLLYLQRSHDTQFGSVETAIMKANSAVAFKRPTKSSEDAVMSGRLIHLALPAIIPAEGGVPILHNGEVIGGIGVSGARSFQDGQVALAGITALK